MTKISLSLLGGVLIISLAFAGLILCLFDVQGIGMYLLGVSMGMSLTLLLDAWILKDTSSEFSIKTEVEKP